MKTASTALKALLLNSRAYFMAELFTFTLFDGTVLRYTTWDADLTVSGNFFDSGDVLFNRSTVQWALGTQVDSLTVNAYPQASSTVEGIPFLTAVRLGVFDGATFELDRLFMATPGDTSAGAVVIFTGRVGDIVAGRSTVTFTINSYMELLNVDMPKYQWQPSCVWTVYDVNCGVNRATFQVTTTATGTPKVDQIPFGSGQANGYFADGTLKFTSGVNAGLTRSIGTNTSGVIFLVTPFPSVPLAGDSMVITPGCNRTQGRCVSPFNNLAKFRAYPFIPTAETAL